MSGGCGFWVSAGRKAVVLSGGCSGSNAMMVVTEYVDAWRRFLR